MAALGNDRQPFASVRDAGVIAHTSGHAPPLEEKPGAVGKRILHGVHIEVLIDAVSPIMASPARLGADRPRILHPAAFVDVVDVEIAEAAATRPQKAV